MTDAGARATVTALERVRLEGVARLVASGSGGIAGLMALLDDPSWSVRRTVIAALAELGDAAVTTLCESLQRDRSDETRIAATVDTLAASAGDVERALIALTPTDNAAVAADVAQILGRRRNARSVPTLVLLLEHEDDNVAVAAIEALGRIGGRAAVDALVETVERQTFFRTYPAVDVLGRSGDPRAVAPLAKLLHQPQFALEAARALGRTADRGAVTPLAELLLSSVEANVRVAAVALSDLMDSHAERYGSALLVREALKEVATAPMVRRVAQALTSGDAGERVAMCTVLGAFEHENGAPALTRMLDGTPAVASAAAAALRSLGRAADEQLRIALEHGDSVRRQILLPILPHAGSAAEVLRCLDDPDSTVRALACDALARLGNPEVIGTLFEQLSDPNPRVVQAAIGAIQSLGSNESEALAIKVASSPLPSARRAALRVLSYFGSTAAMDAFEKAASDPDARVRDIAISGVALLEHPRARQLLLESATDADERTRIAAMRGLGQSALAEVVVDALRAGLGDEQPWVRYYACQALGKLGAHEATEAITARLHDEAGQVRVAAVEALSHLSGAVALEALQTAARSEEPDIQRAALIGLGMMRANEALPAIIAACSAHSAATRQVALSALHGFDAPEVLAILSGATRDEDEGVRLAAIELLASVPKREATQLLISTLGDERARARVLQALATPAHGRIEALLAALESADDELAPVLVSTLGRVDPLDATGALLGVFSLPNTAARKAAAGMLAAKSTHGALAALKQHASSDPSDEVRRVCALYLAQ